MIISRGLGGKGGKRSIITARGGAGSGGKCLKKKMKIFFLLQNKLYLPSYYFSCKT